jgi:hemoglobin
VMESYHLSRMSTLPIVPAPDRLSGDRIAPVARQAPTPSHGDLGDANLHSLLTAFYAAAANDPLLAPRFAPLDMTAHLPRIVDFWSTMLFHTGRYSGNAFRPHLEMQGLAGEHFTRWVATLEETLDASHAGPNVEQMKVLARRIALSMQMRLGIEPADY